MRHGLWTGLLVLGLGFAASADAATCTWGGSSGNWSVGANWSGCGGAAPGASDTAVINSGTPQVDVASTVAGLTINGGGLGGAQNLNVTTAFVWSGGALSGPDLSAELILDAGCTSTFGPSGSGRSISNRTLRNRGTFNRADSTGTITLSNAAEIINEGVWNGGASNWIATGSGSGTKRFTNAVAAQYNHASGSSYLAVEVVNNGTISVSAGLLQLSGGGTLAGSQTLAAGATLEVQSAALNVSGGATFTGAGTLRIIGGALTFNGAVSVPNLAIGGGVVNGAGTPTITGGLNWYAAAILQGSGLGDQMILDTGSVNSFSVSINSPQLQNRTLVNRGTMTRSNSTATLTFANAAEIINEGTWNGGSTNWFAVGSGVGTKRFSNAAGAQYNHASGSSWIGTEFVNNGTISVSAGLLQLSGGGTLAGSQTLAAGATLEVQSAALNVSGGATFTGAGTLRIIGGALTFNGAVSVPNLAIGGGVVNGAGTPTITGGLNWYAAAILQGSGLGDQMILDTGSVNSFSVSINSPQLQNRTLVNRGTMTRSNSTATLTFANAAEIINEGTWNGGSTNWFAVGSGVGTKRFSNAAGAQYNHASGSSWIGTEFVNNGTLSVSAGLLQLNGGGTLAGSQTLAAGATLEVQSAALNVSGGATFTGAGTLRIIGGALTFNGAVSVPNLAIGGGVVNGAGTPTITGGLNWYAAAILQGSGLGDQMILDTGSVNGFSVPINSPQLQNRTLINRGTMNQQPSTSSLVFAAAAEVVNEGVWNMDSLTSFSIGAGAGSKRFRNEAGATLSKIGAATSTIGTELTNAGSLQITVDTTLSVNAFTQSAGMTTLASDGFLQQLSTPLAFQGGQLRGVGTVQGSVLNTGATVAPGSSPGTLTITGSYTQSAAGALEIEIAGAAAGDFDKLAVTGAASLTGTVSFVLLGGFVPTPADSFQFLATSSRSGYFSGVTNPASATHFIDYSATAATLTASGSNGAAQPTACFLWVHEGAQVEVPIERVGGLDQASADWTTAPVNATPLDDYLPVSGSAVFAAGSLAARAVISIPDDGLPEGPEEFVLQLSGGSAGVSVSGRTVVVRILDGEGVYIDGFEGGCPP